MVAQVSGKLSRSKGCRGEREVATLLRRWLPEYADAIRRGWQSRSGKDGSDVEGLPWHIEVKRRAGKVDVGAALRQGLADSDGRPVLVFHRSDRSAWRVTMFAHDWLPWRDAPWTWAHGVIVDRVAGASDWLPDTTHVVTMQASDWLPDAARHARLLAPSSEAAL